MASNLSLRDNVAMSRYGNGLPKGATRRDRLPTQAPWSKLSRLLFIRWQLYPRQSSPGCTNPGNAGVRWTAVLAQSVRVDGKTRQKRIACLGSYHEHDCDRIPLWYVGFWRRAAAHLDQLGNRISLNDREKIEAAIARKIQRPTPHQCEIAERYDAEMAAWFGSPQGTPRPAWPEAQ
jgi:hypothetical protein